MFQVQTDHWQALPGDGALSQQNCPPESHTTTPTVSMTDTPPFCVSGVF